MTQDQYKLDQASPRGHPGWEAFQSKDDKLFYFHFNDEGGRPLLFSQAYQNAKSRDRGMASVKKNGVDPAHFEEAEANGAYYFILKAGNHQEIARSRVFATRTERKKAMADLKNEAGGPPEKTRKPVVDTMAPTVETGTEQPSHFRFVLSFYPAESGSPLRGKIEYPLIKEDKDNFDGIDLDRIGSFIAHHLPGKVTAPPRPVAGGIKLSKPITFLKEGRPIAGIRLPHDSPVELRVSLAEVERRRLRESSHYRAQVYAKPIKEKDHILVGEKEGELSTSAELRIPILTQNLKNKVYRFTLYLDLDNPEDPRQGVTVEGSQLAQVF